MNNIYSSDSLSLPIPEYPDAKFSINYNWQDKLNETLNDLTDEEKWFLERGQVQFSGMRRTEVQPKGNNRKVLRRFGPLCKNICISLSLSVSIFAFNQIEVTLKHKKILLGDE